mgnify:CR=1 FL=1|jgi:hypothetical protein
MTNNNTNESNTMKIFNITYVDPWTNRECRHLDVHASLLRNDEHGQTWFTGYNKPIEVITATLVDEKERDAKIAYFNTHGTASE